MDTGTKLRKLRDSIDKTQLELSKLLHVTKSTISMYERNERTPSPDILKKYSQLFDVSIDYLLGTPNDTVEMLGQAVTMNKYPYIDDYVSAGSPVNIEGMKDVPNIYVPDELLGSYAGSKRLFFLKVNGESMNKIIPNGSTIGVISYDSINDIKNGDIVVYATEDHSFAVKYFYKEENKLIFKPSSTYHYYYDKAFDINDNIRIIGKVVIYSVML
ncbi:XRE family transcriptional regulator [Anaerococcus vaginalis]|uniref:LexA family protein n=1 Tax=Anaerococcus vaginalis TaxID=33037 RepID=UPI00291123EB|nr:XRE family transcriptional regulator [Anaerococcus vaginalis]MDU5252661.1 XRE family transcriptional regulator [Anaerococcus vaginalis]MDU6781418.1 XRE family transcriptional regulator [Anaerococcus vaginalis]